MKRRQFSEISPSFFGNWNSHLFFFLRTYREGTWNGNLPCNSGWMGTSPEMYGWFWENPRRIKNSRWDSKVSCLIKSASSSAIWRSRADKGRRLAPLNIKLFPAGSIDAAPASPFGPIRQPCWRTYKKRMTLCQDYCFIFCLSKLILQNAKIRCIIFFTYRCNNCISIFKELEKKIAFSNTQIRLR